MRKFLACLLVVLLLGVPLFGLAEVAEQPPGFDWTGLVVWIIGAVSTALVGLLTRAWMTHVRPWLEKKGIMDAADIVVNAVEALIGRGHGNEKLSLALAKMKERGFNVDDDIVMEAVLSAWHQLNLSQIMVGVKDVDEKPPDNGSYDMLAVGFQDGDNG